MTACDTETAEIDAVLVFVEYWEDHASIKELLADIGQNTDLLERIVNIPFIRDDIKERPVTVADGEVL